MPENTHVGVNNRIICLQFIHTRVYICHIYTRIYIAIYIIRQLLLLSLSITLIQLNAHRISALASLYPIYPSFQLTTAPKYPPSNPSAIVLQVYPQVWPLKWPSGLHNRKWPSGP